MLYRYACDCGPDLVMMWHGSSNGYYSEGVTVDIVDEVPDTATETTEDY